MNIYRVFWGTYGRRPLRDQGKGMAAAMRAVPKRKMLPCFPGGKQGSITRRKGIPWCQKALNG